MTAAAVSPPNPLWHRPPRSVIGLWGLALVALSAGVFQLVLEPDTAQELRLARNCLELGECSTGVMASVPGIAHGEFILRVIEAMMLFQLSWGWLRFFGSAMLAAAAVVVVRDAEAVVKQPPAWFVFALTLAVLSYRFDPAKVYNICALPFFGAAFVAATLRCGETGSIAWGAAAGGALGMAADCEVGALIAVPCAVLLLVTSGARWPRTIAAAGAAFIAGPLLFSAPVWRNNIQTLVEQYPTLLALAAGICVVAAIAGIRLRPVWRRWTAERRRLAALVVIAGTVRGAVVIASATGIMASAPSRFTGVAWSAEIFLILMLVAFLRRRTPTRVAIVTRRAATAGLMLFVLAISMSTAVAVLIAARPEGLPEWSVQDMADVARYLGDRGMDRQGAMDHVWAAQGEDVLLHLQIFLPAQTGTTWPDRDVFLLKVRSSVLPPELPMDWTALPIGWWDVALIHTYQSELNTGDIRLGLSGSMDASDFSPASVQTGRAASRTLLKLADASGGRRVLGDWHAPPSTSYRFTRRPGLSTHSFATPGLTPYAHWSIWFQPAGDDAPKSTMCYTPVDGEPAIVVRGAGTRTLELPDLLEFTRADRTLLARVLPTDMDWSGCD